MSEVDKAMQAIMNSQKHIQESAKAMDTSEGPSLFAAVAALILALPACIASGFLYAVGACWALQFMGVL